MHLLTVVLRMMRILGARIGRDPERAVMQGAMSHFDWQDSDVFVAASSSLGVLSRVFLGDLTHKLLRASTVPAVVLPRGFDPEGRFDA